MWLWLSPWGVGGFGMDSAFDAVVVGTGQAGPPLAVRLAKQGQRVAVIERQRFGGTCVNYGCIPTKTLVASARVAHLARRAADFGVAISGPVGIDMKKVHARMRAVAEASEHGVEAWLRGTAGIEIFAGHARFIGPRRLLVATSTGDREISGDRVFLDVGARALVPKLKGLSGQDQVPFLTNHQMLELDTVPRQLVILGGGYISLEFAQMFCRFGSQVTVIERGPRLLPHEDPDIASEIQRLLGAEGIAFRIGKPADSVEREGSGVAVILSGGERVSGSQLLVAVGRAPNTEDLGVESGGIRLDRRGFIEVDDQLRTSAEGVWALGDCNGKGAFTHTAYNDYEIVAANLLCEETRRVTDRVSTSALYVDPPLGRAGLNEAQVRERGKPALVAKMPMTRVGRAKERGETDGFLKVYVDAESQAILGASFLGIEADEVVQLLLPSMTARRPYTELTRTMLIHPTVSELIPTLFEDFLKPLGQPEPA